MTQDHINKKNIYFPSYSGSNENLIILLNKTSQIICKWFFDSENMAHLGLMIILNVICLMKVVVL